MNTKTRLLTISGLLLCASRLAIAEPANIYGNVQPETLVKTAEIQSLQAKVFTIPDSNKINMVLIPAGTFTMGSPKEELGRRPGETPHEVTISKPFYMGETEISQKQFLELAQPNFKPIMARLAPWGHSLSEMHQGGPWKAQGKYHRDPSNDPMESVTWMRAMRFCSLLTAKERKAGRLPKGYVYRLPTEAEWEYACRAGTTDAFNNPRMEGKVKERGRLSDNVFKGSFPNRFGLFRMHMGVFEWCLDDYAPYQSGKATDPVFFDNSKNLNKVARGGDNDYFMHPKIHNKKLEDPIKIRRYVRSASRGRFGPGIPYPIVGFRPVLAPAIKIPVPNIPEDELVVPVE